MPTKQRRYDESQSHEGRCGKAHSALDSDDAAVRFYAITSLYKLTNQTLEYRYYDDVDERRPAVERWKQWLAAQPPTPLKQ